MAGLGYPPEGDSSISVCHDGYTLGSIPDVTRSCCARQKDAGFIRFAAWSTWPRGARKHGNVSPVSFYVAVFHRCPNFRNVAELRDISLKSAFQHKFELSLQGVFNSDPIPPHFRGSIDALQELKVAGCHMTTQEWVDNHWSLILWKLAGMAILDPDSEADVNRRRWSWAETMRQLQYRYIFPFIFHYVNRIFTLSYEKELNRGARPALRLITTQDASAGHHVILCVSGITWSEGGIGDDGLPRIPHPTLELTDGWYRLRTRVDEVLARAARRGVIRVGRKVSVSGASVRFRFSAVASRKMLIYIIAPAQHRTLRGVRGIRQSRT